MSDDVKSVREDVLHEPVITQTDSVEQPPSSLPMVDSRCIVLDLDKDTMSWSYSSAYQTGWIYLHLDFEKRESMFQERKRLLNDARPSDELFIFRSLSGLRRFDQPTGWYLIEDVSVIPLSLKLILTLRPCKCTCPYPFLLNTRKGVFEAQESDHWLDARDGFVKEPDTLTITEIYQIVRDLRSVVNYQTGRIEELQSKAKELEHGLCVSIQSHSKVGKELAEALKTLNGRLDERDMRHGRRGGFLGLF